MLVNVSNRAIILLYNKDVIDEGLTDALDQVESVNFIS